VLITGRLRSYSAAKAEVVPGVERCRDNGQNNRAENSHQPTSLQERVMRKFKSAGHAQRFLSAFAIITSHFRVGRHLYKANGYREVMKQDSPFGKRWLALKQQLNTSDRDSSCLSIMLFLYA
jgi:putative transposase